MKKIFLQKLMVAFSLISLVAMVGCNTEDVEYPGAKLVVSEVTPPQLPAQGGESEFTIESNRPWTVDVADADKAYVSVEPASGKGSAKVKVNLLANSGEERIVNLTVTTQISHEYVKITQAGAIATEKLFAMTFGTTGPSKSPWLYPDTYTDWGATGTGATAVTYAGSGASLRTPSKVSEGYTGASGGTSVFFGADGHFEINKIATGGANNFIINFGVTRYQGSTPPAPAAPDANVFYPERMPVSISADGTSWTQVAYTFVKGDIWNYATVACTLPAGSSFLYIKFAVTEPSTMRVDDVVVKSTGELPPVTEVMVTTGAASNITETGAVLSGSYMGPQDAVITELGVEYKTATGTYVPVAAINAVATPFTVTVTGLTAATEYTYRAYAKVTGKGTVYGSESTFRAGGGATTTALYYESVGNMAGDKPFVDVYTGWLRQGTLSQSAVTYTRNGNVSVRVTAKSAGYDGASGENNVFMGTSIPEFTIGKINVTGKTQLQFMFGISHEGVYTTQTNFLEITPSTIKLQASLDGTAWTDLTYTNASTLSWVVATSQFKVPAGTTQLYIKFSQVVAESKLRVDDFKLVEGGSGTIIVGEGGGEVGPATLKSISEVRALKSNIPANNNTYVIADNWKIKGRVISDNATKHLQVYQLAVQEGTAANSGIMVNLKEQGATHTFAIGDEVEIVIKDATLKNYNNLIQVIVPKANITKTAAATAPVSATTIAADKLADYESMYIAIAKSQVNVGQLGIAKLNDGSNPNFNMEVDGSASTFVMFVNKAATFAGEATPQLSGTLKGIAGVYGEVRQVLPTTFADFSGMTAPRFGAAMVLTYGTPKLEGTMTAGAALAAANKVSLPFTGAKVGDAYSISLAVSGAGAAGMTTPVAANGTFAAIAGNIEFALAGTPTAAGAVTFTITGAGSTPITLNGTVNAAGGGALGEFTSNMTLPTTDNSTDFYYVAKVIMGAGGTEYGGMKFGSSSKVGKYTFTALPATGNPTLGFYAVTWNNKAAQVKVTVNNGGTIDGAESKTFDIRGNSGGAGSPPFTVTPFTAEDYFTAKLAGITAATTLTFESIRVSDPRAIFVGCNLK